MKTVLITGATRGIGKATALLFAQKNYNVVINYCSNDNLAQDLLEELNKDRTCSIAIKADVSDQPQVKSMIEEAFTTFGSIDVLINNAGIAQQKLFTDITQADWNRMFNVNITGMFHCSQAVLPHMIHKKSGKIVNISSIWGIAGASCEVHYSASKAAVIGFTKALAKEVGPSNIQVNCVAPGVIETDMNINLDAETLQQLKEETPLQRIGSPQNIADTIYFLSSEQSDFITGQVISPNGGFII